MGTPSRFNELSGGHKKELLKRVSPVKWTTGMLDYWITDPNIQDDSKMANRILKWVSRNPRITWTEERLTGVVNYLAPWIKLFAKNRARQGRDNRARDFLTIFAATHTKFADFIYKTWSLNSIEYVTPGLVEQCLGNDLGYVQGQDTLPSMIKAMLKQGFDIQPILERFPEQALLIHGNMGWNPTEEQLDQFVNLFELKRLVSGETEPLTACLGPLRKKLCQKGFPIFTKTREQIIRKIQGSLS